MNLQDLIYFKHLSESLSFTTTAEHFYVSQPSISTALKRLEAEFNTILVDRRKTLKQIQLTPAGELLYEKTKKVLDILETAQRDIQDLKQETVYYGFLPTIGGHFLPKILSKLNRFTKSLKLIEEESSDLMLEHVKQEKVSIAIIGHEIPAISHPHLKQFQILDEEMALWVAPDHPLTAKESVETKDLKDEIFISLTEGYTHQRIFEKWAHNNKIAEPNIVYAKEIRTVHSIAASTQMVAFMSDIIVDENSDLVKVSLKEAPKFYISLILNTEMETSLSQQEFNEGVVAAVKEDFE